ncbi:MAG TPA: GSU2403 family nucleotidyltransferase fold protein [archaeon]|nr:GSU2403 family nucleotidyltransferase fold protein [archaeon]
MIEARKALLDVLEALGKHRDSAVLIGAQALYIHTTEFKSPVAAFTQDADLAFNVQTISTSPSIEIIMRGAGFELGEDGNPGRWFSQTNVPVDIMIPKKLAGKGSRSAEFPNHGTRTARSAEGIEGCLVDHSIRVIGSDDPGDARSFEIFVAGPSAILIAKSFKIYERLEAGRTLKDKDSHDVYRLLSAVNMEVLTAGLAKLLTDPLSEEVTHRGLQYIQELFADGASAPGSESAGRAEENIGSPETVAQSVAALAEELLSGMREKL